MISRPPTYVERNARSQCSGNVPPTKERTVGRKTFTGCWTCRARKLKCDETYPHCNQCTRKNLDCEGYLARLQWLPFDSGPGDGPAVATRTTASQRRQISFSIPNSVFADSQLDKLLEDVDGDASHSPKTSQHGPFGVFPANGQSDQIIGGELAAQPYTRMSSGDFFLTGHYTAPAPQGHPQVPGAVSATQSSPSYRDITISGEHVGFPALQAPGLEPVGSGEAETVVWSNLDGMWTAGFSPGDMFLTSPFTSTSNMLGLAGGQEQLTTVANTPPRPYSIPDERNLEESKDECLVDDESDHPVSPMSTILVAQPAQGPFLIKPKIRFLLSHYVKDVINSFCIVTQNTRSPWKSIHLPRALQGSGELEVMGETSHARGALLNALLAVSAYCLSNRYEESRQYDERAKWRKIGSQLRLQVLTSLQMGFAESNTAAPVGGNDSTRLEAGLTGGTGMAVMGTGTIAHPARPKYKELLAAMLSMVSVDVASGDTATTQTHLQGCESLILSAKGWKTHYSSKARSLHRIFYYLRVIYATTNLADQDFSFSASPSGVPAGSPQPPSTRAWLEETLCDNSEKAASCEFIYGVPASLLILLGSVTDVVRRLDHLRRSRQQHDNGKERCGSVPGGRGGGHGKHATNKIDCTKAHMADAAALEETCDQLEAEILSYPVDAILAASLGGQATEDRDIIQHQTRAFHQAVIIYFCQNVRSMHSLYLKPYVEAVIAHAEAIEAIKRRRRVSSGTLYWPCFIAAGEAVEEELQQRFLDWYNTTYGCNFAGCLQGRDVVMEVWRRRQSGFSRQQSSWRAVIESHKICLMLT